MKFPKYNNADTCKDQILSENTDKSGIYRLKNLTNGKRYVGSAMDLSNRLLFRILLFLLCLAVNIPINLNKKYRILKRKLIILVVLRKERIILCMVNQK